MNMYRKLRDGDVIIEKLFEDLSSLGVDAIELRYNNKTGMPTYDVVEINGFKFPRLGNINLQTGTPEGMWVDGTLRFFPDKNGVCWGYLPDIPENRDLIKTSLSTNWFFIVDKRLREELIKEAQDEGIDVTVPDRVEVGVKKTKKEREAERHAATLAKRLEEAEMKQKELREELAIAKGEKVEHLNKRLRGVKIPDRETARKNIQGDD